MIGKFQADMGATNIIEPVREAINMHEDGKWTNNGHKRIFMLTDGFVGSRDKEELLEITIGTSNRRFYTFGIGDDCDKDLVVKMAKAGRGTHYIIGDDKSHLVSSKIIDAL